MADKRDVISAPMSFTGSSERVKNWFWREKPVWYKWVFGWWVVPIITLFWWVGVFVWGLVFGLLLAPYRLIRRGSRKRKVEAKRHKELMEALKAKNQI
jgi:hypothetical protein